MMVLPGMTAGTGFIAKRPFASLFVTGHALVVEGIHTLRQRDGVRLVMAGVARRLFGSTLAGEQFVALAASFQLLFVHVGVTAFALGVHSVAQGEGVAVGLVAVTLVACAGLGLDARVVVAVGARGRVLVHVIVVAPLQLAHLGMVAAGAGLGRQLRLVVRSELGVELCRMAGTAGQRRQTRRLALMMAFRAVCTTTFYVFHVT